ncbi:phospho-sugar mutase [Desmospora profundinema]|uniref:Phosphoglucomutase n=1 Tax=Desmospora profundinema TaxID=1571184 RepID=A0ABU1ITX1_9BACL|nr:phospho-sugar mutase [Desmospora profundinema]MDR6227215.1 phosphoglucomutase [Desmospora profundinema]
MQSVIDRWIQCSELDEEMKRQLLTYSDAEREDAFYRHLTFGTAGMRGLIGPGINRINRITVRRVTEGLARVLSKQPGAMERGVAIAFDSRRFSREFAQEAAVHLAHWGIRVHLFPSLRPTPVLSFAVRHLHAAAGIMITASHNPAEYNGYKVYGEDGAQMPPDKVESILRELDQVEDELAIQTGSWEEGVASGRIRYVDPSVDHAYIDQVLSLSLRGPHPTHASLRVVFTPLHGTGKNPVEQVLRDLGFSRLETVARQADPDPAFSTVSSPNPEDPQAFALALEQAKISGADLIIGTDPDADRLGLWARGSDGRFHAFNGNQIGALLLDYVLQQRREQGNLPTDGVVFKSIVTSESGRAIAQQYGVKTVDTLTGFKYIAEGIEEQESSGKGTFLFGYEESYGYLLGSFVRDKDAVQAAMMCCEMTAHHLEHGRTLDQALAELDRQYGAYRETLFSFTFQGKAGTNRMQALMDRFRHTPPLTVGGLAVERIRDFTNGLDGFPPAKLIRFELEGNSWVAIRPSGTEPKIKFYFGVRSITKEEAEVQLDAMRQSIRDIVEAD